MLRRVCTLAIAATSVVAVSGCEELIQDVEGSLPPGTALFIPTPSERAAIGASDSQDEQAVCADGNDVAAAVETRIGDLNDGVAAQRDLLESLFTTTPQGAVGVDNIANYTVEVGENTLSVNLVEDDGEVLITADIDGDQFITGTYKADGTEGAIVLTPIDEAPIASTWRTENDTFDMARVQGDGEVVAAYTDDGTNARLAFTGINDFVPLVAIWNLETGEGAAIEGIEEAGCWGAGDAAADLCTVICDEGLVDALPELPELPGGG